MIASLLSVLGAASPVSAGVSPGTVTVVIGTASRPSRPDQAILDRLTVTGHSYVLVDDSELTAAMADDADFVLLTDSVLRGRVRGDIESTSTPVASMKWGLFRDLGFLERGGRAGRVGGGKTITINDSSHPLAAGFSGDVEVLTRNVAVGYANIGDEGTMVAERGMARRMRSTIFAYEEGETLSSGAVAPGRRIGTFIANAVVTRLNSNGWALFDAMIDYGLDGAIVVPNRPPDVDDQIFEIVDNAMPGDSIGTVSATDPDNDPLTFSLDDESYFSIDPNTGELTVVSLSEASSPLTAIVTVTDPGNLTDTALVEVNLTPANQPPTVEDQSFTVDEDAVAGDFVATVAAFDPDLGDTLMFSLSDESEVEIDAATGDLTVASTASLVPGENIVLTVTVLDPDGLSDDATITITVEDVNDPPVVEDQSFSIDETAGTGDVVGTVVATDPDVGDTLTYSLDDESDITIDPDLGEMTVAPTAALVGGTDIVLTVTVQDLAGSSTDATITISVGDVNNPPVVEDQSFSVDEDADDVFATVVASDPDPGDTITFALDDESQISIGASTGELELVETNRPDPGDVVLTVTVTDQDGASASATLTVTVLDVNEPPVVNDQAFSVSETAVAGDAVGTVVATDPDFGDSLTYSLDDESDVEIDSSTGELTVAASANLIGGSDLTLAVTVADVAGLTDVATITVSVTDVNMAPSVSDQVFTIDEDAVSGDVVGTVIASDPDGDALTFSLDDVSNFEIDVSSGEITVAPTANLVPGDVVLTVTVADPAGLANDAMLTVTVLDVNEPPVVNDQAFVILETDQPGDPVGTVQFSDPDAGDTFTVTLDDESDIEIADNGDMMVAATANLVGGTDIVLTVTVTDAGGLFDTATIIVAVGNVNDPPTVTITAPGDGDIFTEGDDVSFAGTAIDPEDGDISTSLAWMSNRDGALSGGASFITNSLSVGSHVITASVVDSDGAMVSQSIVIEVLVNTAPMVTITAPTTGDSFVEGDDVSFAGTAIDTEDGDISASLAWVSNRDGVLPGGASFITNSLSVGSHAITASVIDSNGETSSDTIAVTIVPPNRAPVVNDQGFNVEEDAAAATVVGTVAANDLDGDSLTFSLDDTSQIDIDSSTGELTVVDVAGLIAGTDIVLTVTVADPDGLSDTATITVGIGSLSIGLDEVVDGEINPSGDTDTFEFAASAGDTLFFDILDLDAAACSANFRWTVTAPSGATLFDSAFLFNCDSDQGPLTLTESGTYSLTIFAPADETGSYQFEIVTVPEDVPTAIGYDTPTSGGITVRGETDSFTFTGAVGDLLFFDVLDLNGTCDGNQRWTLTAPSGATVFDDAFLFNCNSDRGPLTLAEAGTFTLVFDDPGDELFTVEFEIVTVPEDVPTAIGYDTPTSGGITVRGETDSFTFTGAVGDLLFFDVLDLNGICDGNQRWTLTAPSGATVFDDAFLFNCNSDRGPLTLAEAGTFTLVVYDPGDELFTVEFEIVTVPEDVPTAIGYDTPTSGGITVRGETDSFTFTGAIGDELEFDILDLNGTCDGNQRWTLTAPSGATVFNNAFLFNCNSDRGPLTLAEAGTFTLVFDDPGDELFTVEFEIVTIAP